MDEMISELSATKLNDSQNCDQEENEENIAIIRIK